MKQNYKMKIHRHNMQTDKYQNQNISMIIIHTLHNVQYNVVIFQAFYRS